MDIEKHIEATIANIPRAELRPLLAKMLARLVAVDGSAFTQHLFPIIGAHWQEPPRWTPQ